jgi:hypothetical protein
MPHGIGKICCKQTGPESYPVDFEFYGKFKAGKKVDYGKKNIINKINSK